ncbi:MAG: tail length tape measure protein [Caudoviricetes sp.]|nr:MAG: tail length tape measure protein [Caudoviricetes sp.]
MPTIAELQINLDARPIKEGTQDLINFANAAERASKASKINNQTNNDSVGSANKAAKAEENLTAMIDSQTRKLENLAQQRKRLDASSMKSTMPAEYERLNKIIDANIQLVMRQGNAVDTLNNKQDRDVAKREAAVAAELRAAERQIAAAERRENVITRAAAREQRQIDATLNGLNKQIAAQNQYNDAMEKLNRTRALSGMSGPNDQRTSMSGGEYESYTKMAEARRSAASATEDNNRAITAAQNKLDTYTATLGRVERAEVQFARAVRVLDDNLQKGNITQDQYNQKLERFASHRDKAIAKANDNSAAEAKFARELNNVMGAYDPVIRAQQQYDNSIQVLKTGLDNGVISIDQYNKAMRQQADALESVKTSQSDMNTLGDDYDKAMNSLVPYRAELRNIETQEKVLQQQMAAGKVVTEQQVADHNKATAALQRHRTEIEKRVKAGGDAAMSYKQEQAALRGMPAQITDIIVSLQGGQAPLTVLLQQGGQIKDMFGGIGPAIKGMSTALMAMVNPLTVVGAATAAFAAAAYSGSQEVTDFNRALIQTGNASGMTAGQFSLFRDQLDQTVGTAGKAADALTLIAKSGKIASDMFVDVAEAAITMERATGTAMDETIKDFTALGKDPVNAAVTLDEKYKFLTVSVLAQADALVRQGQEQEAVKLLQTELAETVTETANKMIEEAGYIERAWTGVKDVIGEVWDAMKGIGRDDSSGDRMAELVKRQAELQGAIALNKKYLGDIGQSSRKEELAQVEKEITQLQQRMNMEKYSADFNAANEAKRAKAVAATAALEKDRIRNLKGVEKAEYELAQARKRNASIRAGADTISPELNAQMLKAEADAVKELNEAKEKAAKTKVTPVDSTGVQEVKGQLATITAEYEGHYKRITALGEANIVSDEATYQSQKAILEAQRKATEEAFTQQISAINKLQGNKKNSASQNIALNNQETKAEADKLVALEKIDAKMDALTSKEEGRLKKRAENIAAYKAALDSQLESLVEEGARNADGVGRGSRQAGVDRQLGQIDRRFNRDKMELANQQGGMDPDEYSQKLAALEKNHTKMTKQVLDNNEQMKAASYDWSNGFNAAVENALDAGMNFAGTMEGMLTGAFNSAGDALAKFVTTGKLNFKDFAYSVMADMAAMAAKQAAMGAMGALFKVAGAAIGGYFGGAPASAGSTAAGYSPDVMNAWSAGQAQGGAWSGGTQYFANGGAFTNSVVSTPTAFGMSGNRKGVMGEAGPEAIVPLARTRNGDLGVRMMGGDGGGSAGTMVVVNVNVTESGTTSETNGGPGYQQFGNELGQFVDSRIHTIINSETRPGGSLQAQGA